MFESSWILGHKIKGSVRCGKRQNRMQDARAQGREADYDNMPPETLEGCLKELEDGQGEEGDDWMR